MSSLKPELSWDFSNINHYLDTGLSDSQLTEICNQEYARSKDQDYCFTRYPTISWTSEVYGFGKCFRLLLNWPKILPLPFHSDHGADPDIDLYDIDKQNPTSYHVHFYPPKKNYIHRDIRRVRPINLIHPFAFYRRHNSIELSPISFGGLIFVPHSIPGFSVDNTVESVRKYLSHIKSNYSIDLALCVHMHDINAGLHLHLRELQLPIFSLGFANSPLFVDRFYNLCRNYNCAFSSNIGSQAYYCTELGMKYYVCGPTTSFVNVNNPHVLPGDFESNMSTERRNLLAFERFCFSNTTSPHITKSWSRYVLSTHLEHVPIHKYRIIFFFELLRLIPSLFITFIFRSTRAFANDFFYKHLLKLYSPKSSASRKHT